MEDRNTSATTQHNNKVSVFLNYRLSENRVLSLTESCRRRDFELVSKGLGESDSARANVRVEGFERLTLFEGNGFREDEKGITRGLLRCREKKMVDESLWRG